MLSKEVAKDLIRNQDRINAYIFSKNPKDFTLHPIKAERDERFCFIPTLFSTLVPHRSVLHARSSSICAITNLGGFLFFSLFA